MPVSSTKDLIQFVNTLESKLNNVMVDVDSWKENRNKVIGAMPQVDLNKRNSVSALIKAEEAMAEINTATFGVAAAKGQRLRKLIDEIRAIIDAAVEGGLGGGEGTGVRIEDRFTYEINHAISSVDSVIDDGLKLDYRLRQIQTLAKTGKQIAESTMFKDLLIPYTYHLYDAGIGDIEIQAQEGIEFVDAEATVLSEDRLQPIIREGNLVTASITQKGKLVFNVLPAEPVVLYFPVRMNFKDVPEDVLYRILQLTIEKNNPVMEKLLTFESYIEDLWDDVQKMKGMDWTVDHNIMQNHRDIIKEMITPKGLTVEVIDDKVIASFSYNDHPLLDHFILERWDEDKKDFVPYDGSKGIVAK